jgi:anti-sigma factor RsiW
MCYEEGHLLAYLDGELTVSDRAEVATHVSACAECAGQLERLAADRDVAAEALGKLQPASPGSRLRLRAKMLRPPRECTSAGHRWPPW